MKRIIVIVILAFLGTVPFGDPEIALAGTVPKPRYISLAPSTTEILFALGLDDEVAGVSSYCNYPRQALSKEKVGGFSRPNLEKIVSLRPDYVFCTGLEQAPIIAELKRLGLNVYISDPANIKELISSISDIGKITGRQKEAGDLIRAMGIKIEEISAKVRLVPENKRPKVFIEVWHDPLTTAGIGSFVDEMVTLAGGRNIAYDTKRPYSIFSTEEVISRNPDCIILTYMEKEKPLKLMEQRFGWKNVAAVKNNRIYSDIDPNILIRPGPRVAAGIEEIHKRLYP